MPSYQTVHVENCDSDIDTELYVLDTSFSTISTSYCSGDDCGSCSGSQEEFDMPLDDGSYYVRIEPHYSYYSGSYEVSVCCSDDYTCEDWSSEYWWIWLLVAIFVCCLIGVCCRNKCNNAHSNGVAHAVVRAQVNQVSGQNQAQAQGGYPGQMRGQAVQMQPRVVYVVQQPVSEGVSGQGQGQQVVYNTVPTTQHTAMAQEAQAAPVPVVYTQPIMQPMAQPVVVAPAYNVAAPVVAQTQEAPPAYDQVAAPSAPEEAPPAYASL